MLVTHLHSLSMKASVGLHSRSFLNGANEANDTSTCAIRLKKQKTNHAAFLLFIAIKSHVIRSTCSGEITPKFKE